METSQSSQAEAAYELRKYGISIIPDDNDVVWSLIINKPDFKIDDFKYIRAFPKLKYVDLSESSLDDEGMKCLDGIITLEKVYLSKTQITDKGITSLSGLNNLAILDLSNTLVTDESLKTLALLPSLEFVKVENSSLTEEGMNLFMKNHPKCKFQK